jgi:hypothetical protein
MIENYMDYTTDGCMNIFTNDQKFRIRTVMEVSPRRNTLVACQQAPVAFTGTNIATQPRSWFEYTAASNELLIISSLGTTTTDTRLSLYRECNTLPVNVSDNARGTAQSELTIALQAGESVKILWETTEFVEPFEWTLTSGAQTQGGSCELAKQAVLGSNNVPSTVFGTYWFEFSPSSGHQTLSINSNGRSFSVYGNSCNQLQLLDEGNSSAVIFDVSAGENVFIAFESDGGNFSWTLWKAKTSYHMPRRSSTGTRTPCLQRGT